MDQTAGVSTDTVDVVTCGGCGAQIDVEGITPFAEVECPSCGHIDVVPAKLGQFLLLDLMGEGGMGGVYRATDETLGRQVAIKVMLASLGDDPEFITSFRREAQAIARLNHPHIAQIYSFGQEKGQPYIVMELVSGNRMDGLMEKQEQLDQGLILRTAIEVSLGLQAADEAGLVHGDIKPENILYDEKERAKLVDFGLASAAHERSKDSAIWGTPYYIPPEKIRRQKLDARADIYSLGGTLYHALTGKPPFDGETAVEVVKARLEAPPTPIKELRPDIDERLGAIVMRMLELEPARRYPTYTSLLSDLRRCAKESNIKMAPKSRKAGKKRVVIKKRGRGTPTRTSSSSAATSAPAAQTGKQKLIIHKSTTGSARYKTQGLSAAKRAPTEEELRAQKAKKDAARKRRQGVLVTFLVIIAIAAGVTGTIFHRKAKHATQLAYYNLTSSKSRGTASLETIAEHAEKLQEIHTTAKELNNQATNDAFRVTGYVPELPPLKLPEPVADTNVTTDATNTTVEATNAAPTEAETTDAATEVDADSVDSADDAAVAEDEMAEDEMAEPEEPVEIPEIHLPVVDVGVAQRDIARFASALVPRLEEAEILRVKLMSATTAAAAAPPEKALAALAAALEEQLTEAKDLLKTVRAKAKESLKLRRAFDEAEAIRIQEEKDEQRRITEAAEAARAARAHQNKVDEEKSQIDQARQTMIPAIQIHDFDILDSQVRIMRRNFKTDEGKAYLKLLTDRIDMLKKMQEIMIKRLTEKGYPFGYGAGGSARDILKADGRGIYVRGVIAPVRWENLTVKDTRKIIDYLLRQRTIRATEKMALCCGAAIYCDSYGERGRATGNAYADRAIEFGMRQKIVAALRPEGW
jgi:serine/threonine protein kinase